MVIRRDPNNLRPKPVAPSRTVPAPSRFSLDDSLRSVPAYSPRRSGRLTSFAQLFESSFLRYRGRTSSCPCRQTSPKRFFPRAMLNENSRLECRDGKIASPPLILVETKWATGNSPRRRCRRGTWPSRLLEEFRRPLRPLTIAPPDAPNYRLKKEKSLRPPPLARSS